MSQLQQNLIQAIELSQRIVDLAQDSAWAEMEEMDHQRKPVLESIFSDADFKVNPGKYEVQMDKIVNLNNQALTLCADAKGDIKQKNRTLKLGREAISAYQKNSFDY
ncbi:MAG: hypothetical protein ABW157_21740 [Candidatus Thiodiazotropha sp. LLP2]